MILIHGTDIAKEQLPFEEIMNYTVEPNEQFFKIKLKTIATSPVCLGVYIHKDAKDKFDIPTEVEEKLHFFVSDEELTILLENGGKIDPIPLPEEEKPEEPETIAFGDNSETTEVVQPEAFVTAPPEKPSVNEDKTHSIGFTLIDTVDVDEDPTEIVFEIPNASEDMDSFKQQIVNKDRIIAQKDAQLLDVTKTLNDLHKLQDIQLKEIKTIYDSRLDEANEALAEAKRKLEDMAIPEDLHGFLKYAIYAQNFKASLQEGYTKADLSRLGKLTSQIHIFAAASGDSYYTYMKALNALLEKKPNVLVVDFSNDQYLISKHKVRTRDSSMQLRDKTIKIESLVKDMGGVSVIPTAVYNDISLLTLDWIDIIKRLNAYANGRPIIFLFNSINSFSVRYTVSKLGTIGEASIFANSNPIILSALLGDMAFIPSNRYKVVALNYIDIVRRFLDHMSQTHKVVAFKDGVEWKKIISKL